MSSEDIFATSDEEAAAAEAVEAKAVASEHESPESTLANLTLSDAEEEELPDFVDVSGAFDPYKGGHKFFCVCMSVCSFFNY